MPTKRSAAQAAIQGGRAAVLVLWQGGTVTLAVTVSERRHCWPIRTRRPPPAVVLRLPGPCRHAVGVRWQVDETYLKVAGRWRFVYRAIDQFGQVIDVFVSPRRDAKAARRFFERAVGASGSRPSEVVSDRAPTYRVVLAELLPAAWHRTDQYANHHIEADHGRLKARLGPMRGLKQDRSAAVIIAGHAFVHNVRRGHYELAVEEPRNRRLAVAFDELALTI
jgi:transposase, IS6 family